MRSIFLFPPSIVPTTEKGLDAARSILLAVCRGYCRQALRNSRNGTGENHEIALAIGARAVRYRCGRAPSQLTNR
jgi:hypothetical protein